jgi:hypothetical protein
MARFVSGEVVVVPFPFTDLSSAKVCLRSSHVVQNPGARFTSAHNGRNAGRRGPNRRRWAFVRVSSLATQDF